MDRKEHVRGRDRDGHRWPDTEGWRCLYCGVRDTRMVMHKLEGHEPEILLASIEPCKALEKDKADVDRLFPMPHLLPKAPPPAVVYLSIEENGPAGPRVLGAFSAEAKADAFNKERQKDFDRRYGVESHVVDARAG